MACSATGDGKTTENPKWKVKTLTIYFEIPLWPRKKQTKRLIFYRRWRTGVQAGTWIHGMMMRLGMQNDENPSTHGLMG